MKIECLKIEEIKRNRIGIDSSEPRKKATLEAISWEKGTISDKKSYPMYEYDDFQVLLKKPGKESPPEYNRCKHKNGTKGNNPNDMTPTLLKKGIVHENKFGFDDIFELIYSIKDKRTLEVLGSVLFRMAYMMEHEIDNSNVRLNISKKVFQFLESKYPEVDKIPLRVFIYMMEIISLNEDVKYYTLGYNDNFKNGTGKRNNLLTYSRLIAVLIGGEKFSAFAGSFARPPVGISSISNSKAFEVFPDLS